MENSEVNKELEFIKENLINWYQFNKNSEVLEDLKFVPEAHEIFKAYYRTN